MASQEDQKVLDVEFDWDGEHYRLVFRVPPYEETWLKDGFEMAIGRSFYQIVYKKEIDRKIEELAKALPIEPI